MIETLLYDIEREFAIGHMRCFCPLLFNPFDEFLTFGPTTFVEAGVDGVFVRIDELAHKESQEQCLAIALGDAESAQQFRCNLARCFVGQTNIIGNVGGRAVEIGNAFVPIGYLLGAVASLLPGVASPFGKPQPVAVDLHFSFAVTKIISRIGMIPIRSLRKEMERIGSMHLMHRPDGLLHKVGRSPAPRLQVGKNVNVLDMHRTEFRKVLVNLCPRATGLIGGQ